MKGFILKDLMIMKRNMSFILVMCLCFFFVIMSNQGAITFVIPFLCIMLCMSCFSYDELTKWDIYASTLPIDKKDIVKSRYIFTIIMVILGAILSFVLFTILTVISGNLAFAEGIGNLFGVLLGTTIAISFMYPILYKFGPTKGRISIFVIFLVGALVIGFLFQVLKYIGIDLSIFNNLFTGWMLLLSVPVIIIICLFVSYTISKNVYLKKEF